MKTAFILLLIIIIGNACFAQKKLLTYPEILTEFLTNYTPNVGGETETVFAKKRDGWHLFEVNPMRPDSAIEDRLFYSAATNNFMSLIKHYKPATEESYEENFKRLLYPDGSMADWYGFERIPYYGYANWQQDVIADFGNKENLSDTLHDALSRTYSKMQSNYLWHQIGGTANNEDSLQIKLGRLQLPSAERIERVKHYIGKSIKEYEKVNEIDSGYNTIVGNGSLKLFNEYLNGYNQLLMCGQPAAALEYIEKATLAQGHIDQAKNRLNSCAPNAILITYGDNDTYQLWYVQEKFNYRKDVTVVNTSLLGLPIYSLALKKYFGLKFSVPHKFLADPTGDFAYREEMKKPMKTRELKNVIADIYAKKDSIDLGKYINVATAYPVFHDKLANISLADKTGLNKVTVHLNKSLYLNDIILLDIISSNAAKRPISFTFPETMLENNLALKGVNYQLVPYDINSAAHEREKIKATEKFILEEYIPVVSADRTFICIDGDNTFLTLYSTVIGYYVQQNDKINRDKWLTLFSKKWSVPDIYPIVGLQVFGFYYAEAGDMEKCKSIFETVAQWKYKMHTNPEATIGYLSLIECHQSLIAMQEFLTSKNANSEKINTLLQLLPKEK